MPRTIYTDSQQGQTMVKFKCLLHAGMLPSNVSKPQCWGVDGSKTTGYEWQWAFWLKYVVTFICVWRRIWEWKLTAYTVTKDVLSLILNEDTQHKRCFIIQNHYRIFDHFYALTGLQNKCKSNLFIGLAHQSNSDIRERLKVTNIVTRDTSIATKLDKKYGTNTKRMAFTSGVAQQTKVPTGLGATKNILGSHKNRS